MRPTVSVIIPCFNASQYIEETLDSIYAQKITGSIEVILIDDGSNDKLKDQLSKYKELQYFYQINSGVSTARNYGLKLAVGDFVIFFDADDIMSTDFIQDRLEPLLKSDEYGFSCGTVEPFPVKKNLLYGAANEIDVEVLLYNPIIATCPSNYLIRRKVLIDNGITYNESLSSSADRFYLLELNKIAKCILVKKSSLLYRISETSMSHHISATLINDSNSFLDEVKKRHLIPLSIEPVFLKKIYYILGAGYVRIGQPLKGLLFLIKRFFINPILYFKKEQ